MGVVAVVVDFVGIDDTDSVVPRLGGVEEARREEMLGPERLDQGWSKMEFREGEGGGEARETAAGSCVERKARCFLLAEGVELLLRREGGQSVLVSFVFEEGEDDDGDSLGRRREESEERILLLLLLLLILLSIEDAVGSL